MTSNNINTKTMKDIFYNLYNSNTEEEIDRILCDYKIFNDRKNWKPYGNNPGNFATFESQQNHPIPALIEKITNSIDAILIRDCLLKGIDPKSPDAPRSMSKAVELFYNIKDGEIGELTEKQRRELAENIQLIAIGDKTQPSIVIYDNGEGQTPENFENTFLSLLRNNKTKIHFVQGKYNMGSTGAVVFCGDKKYQLIASKRCKELTNEESLFGFTLVRRHPLTKEEEFENRRATWYEYFCPDEKIPAFGIDEIDLGLFNRKFTTGTVVKLYSYQLPRGSRSDITLDLWRDLNQYMFNMPLPILVYEKRDYAGKTPSKLVLGNRTRITIDSRDQIEKIIQMNINKDSSFGEIPIEIIIFKPDVKHEEFIKNKSIIFTQNGQVHGYEGQSFISQELGFSLLKRHLLIHVDCTNIPTSIRQDIFMSNRTHLKQCSKTDSLRDYIIDFLRQSSELKRLNNERKNFLIHNNDSDDELIKNVLSKLPVDKDILNLLRKDGSLNFLRTYGEKIPNPKVKNQHQKKLNRFPSIFKLNLKENQDGMLYKTIPINKQGKIEIETDVEDDYLFRPTEKGKFVIEVLQKRNISDKTVNPPPNPNPNITSEILNINREGPIDGTIRLIIKPNEKAKIGDEVEIKAKLSAPGREFECVFQVKVDKELSEPKNKESNQVETFPKLPKSSKAYESSTNDKELNWKNPLLNWSGDDIVKIITSKDGNELAVDEIIVNMDSFVLKRFLSKNHIVDEKEIKLTKNKYFLSIYLHSLFLFCILQKIRKEDTDRNWESTDVEEFVSNIIKPYSNFLIYENHHLIKIISDE